MATRKTTAAAETSEVKISKVALQQLITVVESLESADLAYKNCQATIYRNYAQSLYKAGKTRTAVAEAKAALG